MEETTIGAITAIFGGVILFILKFKSKIGKKAFPPSPHIKIESELKKIDEKFKELTKITEDLNKNIANNFLKMHSEYDAIQQHITEIRLATQKQIAEITERIARIEGPE